MSDVFSKVKLSGPGYSDLRLNLTGGAAGTIVCPENKRVVIDDFLVSSNDQAFLFSAASENVDDVPGDSFSFTCPAGETIPFSPNNPFRYPAGENVEVDLAESVSASASIGYHFEDASVEDFWDGHDLEPTFSVSSITRDGSNFVITLDSAMTLTGCNANDYVLVEISVDGNDFVSLFQVSPRSAQTSFTVPVTGLLSNDDQQVGDTVYLRARYFRRGFGAAAEVSDVEEQQIGTPA